MIDRERWQEFIKLQYRILEELEAISKSLQKPEKKKKEPSRASDVWLAYAASFFERHKCEPVRNKRANIFCGQLVSRLGAEEAIAIAKFYPFHPDPFYFRTRHDLGLLLRDAERIRTDWQTKTVVGRMEAATMEKKIATESQLDRIRKGEL